MLTETVGVSIASSRSVFTPVNPPTSCSPNEVSTAATNCLNEPTGSSTSGSLRTCSSWMEFESGHRGNLRGLTRWTRASIGTRGLAGRLVLHHDHTDRGHVERCETGSPGATCSLAATYSTRTGSISGHPVLWFRDFRSTYTGVSLPRRHLCQTDSLTSDSRRATDTV